LPLLEQAVKQAAADRCFAQHSLRLGWLAEAHLIAGFSTRAAELGHEALRLARHYGERPAEAHILRILGDTLTTTNPQESERAFLCYQQALSISQRQSMQPLRAKCHDIIRRLQAKRKETVTTR
jgi:hypothetical protein